MKNYYVQNIAYRIRKVAGQNVIIGENKCFELNEVASEIWNYLYDAKSEEEIVEFISNEFNVERSRAENDINIFLERMLENKALMVFSDGE